jgi:hypothetical protein
MSKGNSIGNHSAVVTPLQSRRKIRDFHRDVLGCEITRQSDQGDDLRLGGNICIGILHGDDPEESELLRSGKAINLELQTENAEETRRAPTVIRQAEPQMIERDRPRRNSR